MEDYPNQLEPQHLPHEAWHVVQQRTGRRRTALKHTGAEFVGYPSPSEDTFKRFPEWRIEISQGNWKDEIVPGNNPLHSPGLSGEFEAQVFVFCSDSEKYLLWKDKEGNETAKFSTEENSTAMVIFYATSKAGCDGTYYVVGNAISSQSLNG